MTPGIFPLAVSLLVFGSWLVVASLEACTPQNTDPKFDCWTSLQLVAVFAVLGSCLTGLMALLARVILHPYLLIQPRKAEGMSALLASTVLVLLFYTVLPWEFEYGHLGIRVFGWLGASFVICCASLLAVKRWTKQTAP